MTQFFPDPLLRFRSEFPILEESLRQTARISELAARRGFRCATPSDPSRRGETALVDLPNALAISRELNARDVVVDYRPGAGIRMAPHFYTQDAEIDRAFEAIDDIRETGAWKRWTARGSLVT
jgi:kynureninase